MGDSAFRTGLCVAAFVALWATRAVAQGAGTGTIAGEVHDSLGAPLERIEVWIMPSGPGKFTDSRGRFVFTGVPIGNQRVIVRRVGYEPELNDVLVTAGARVDFAVELHRMPVMLAAQLVNVQRERLPRVYERLDQHLGRALFAEDIANFGGRDPSDLLKFSPAMRSQLAGPPSCASPTFFVDGRHVPPTGWSTESEMEHDDPLHVLDSFVKSDEIAVIEAFKSPDFVKEIFLTDDGALTHSSAFSRGVDAGPIKGGPPLAGMSGGGTCQRLVLVWTKYFVRSSRAPSTSEITRFRELAFPHVENLPEFHRRPVGLA